MRSVPHSKRDVSALIPIDADVIKGCVLGDGFSLFSKVVIVFLERRTFTCGRLDGRVVSLGERECVAAGIVAIVGDVNFRLR